MTRIAITPSSGKFHLRRSVTAKPYLWISVVQSPVDGPAREVPAPPSARDVRTREGRNSLRPGLRSVNTERAKARGHGEWF